MIRGRWVGALLAGFALHAALLWGVPESIPAAMRVALAFGVLVMLPGSAFVALGGGHSGRMGTPLGISTDSPDHVGAIRRMLASGDAFPRDAFLRDSFAFAIPTDIAEGDYHVRIRMITQPHYPNVHLRDYFAEDDHLSGLEVGALRVRGHGAPEKS